VKAVLLVATKYWFLLFNHSLNAGGKKFTYSKTPWNVDFL